MTETPAGAHSVLLNAVRSRPADSGCWRVGDEDLARPRSDDVVDLLGATPVGGEHEQRAAVGTPEYAREAGPVELDALQHLAALADTRAVVGVVCGGRPDAAVGIEADAVRSDTVRPRAPIGQAALVVDVEGGEPSGERLGDDQRAVVGRDAHPVRERELVGDLSRLTVWR